MPACLMPVENGRRPVVLDKPIILVGRHPDCDVVLKNSRKVSRKHCCFAQINDHCVVRDLGSMNGVWINDERVEGVADVQYGDTVAIGDVLYRFRQGGLENEDRKGGRSDVRSDRRASGRGVENSEPPEKDQPAKQHELSQDIPIPISEPSEGFSLEAALRETPDCVPLIDDEDDEDLPLLEVEDDEEQEGPT